MTLINNSWYIGTKIMKNPKYSLHLNKVRKNLAANLDRSPLIKEPLNKSYGVSANPEACRCKAQREANGLSPWQGLQRGRCMLHGSPYGAFSAIRTRRCDFLAGYSMPAKSRLDSVPRWKPGIPIGLVQRFPGYCYASAGDRSTLFAIFPLSFVPFVQYAG
jgi:hypothetical protein